MKGTYKLNKKWASRISRDGSTVHLGTYDDEEEAAVVYDVACLIFGRPISAFNYPERMIGVGMIQKVLVILREKDVLTLEDVMKITNRFEVINKLAEQLEGISEHGSETQGT